MTISFPILQCPLLLHQSSPELMYDAKEFLPFMRTTLDLDDDVLEAARSLASTKGNTVGQVISELVRLALRYQEVEMPMRNGVSLFISNKAARRPDLALVNALRDEQ